MTTTPAPARRLPVDLLCVILLIALCWLFYWRLLTPTLANQQSLVEGDFSGQFVAFAQYQAVRLGLGQVPLWNPYNYGGSPFLADTQSAVFYPPRLITIAILNATGGSTPGRMYDALQKEMVTHALLASLLMYALVRRLTLESPHSPLAGLVAGITFAYGGYLTSYPQLQLAVMEAGIWLPLALLGIHEATRFGPDEAGIIRWRWIVVAGVALGLSLMAGHPQTTLFFGYVSAGYLGYRVIKQRGDRVLVQWGGVFLGALVIFGLTGVGLAAVQLLPAAGFLPLTTRSGLNFDALGNGFPFYDVLQMLFPGFLSLWSPLYCGIVGLALAVYAVWRRAAGAIFWIGVALVALGLSFGHGTVIYDVFYTLVPGFNLFRGQERSAYVVAVALSILIGLGIPEILKPKILRRFKITLYTLLALEFSLGAALFLNWLQTPNADSKRLELVAFSLLVATLLTAMIADEREWRWRPAAIVALIIFELFSFARTNPNLEAKPASTRLLIPSVVQPVLDDKTLPFRVDGSRGLRENYGTLYGLADIQGTSPLQLASIERLLKIPAGRLWETLAVRYVFTDNNELPVPSTIVAKGTDPLGPVNLHKLTDPRPFAMLVFKTWIEPNDDAARGILSDPSFDARHTVILSAQPAITLDPNGTGSAAVTNFAPESVTVQTSSSSASILRVALVDSPGWSALVDGNDAPILRADTAVMGVVLPGGDHTIQFTYRSAEFIVGGIVSVISLILVLIVLVTGGVGFVITRTARRTAEPAGR